MRMKGRNIIVLLALPLLLSCGNRKKYATPDYGFDDSLMDVELLQPERIDSVADNAPTTNTTNNNTQTAPVTGNESKVENDNMRGFDPASENDMDDNGMRRFMENNDDEGWD